MTDGWTKDQVDRTHVRRKKRQTQGLTYGRTSRKRQDYSRRQQVTCFLPYPSKVTPTTILLPSIAKETKLVIG